LIFRPTKQASPAVAAKKADDWYSILEERLMKTQKRRKKRTERPETYLAKLRKKLGVRPLVETKRREVAKALSVAQGDKVLAAALLGIGKTTIYRTLENGRF
jgi:transcriptional regulator of acetoin/glycerol metabolism